MTNLLCAEIAFALSLSKSTVHWILTCVLNYRNVFAVWVPSERSEDQKSQRVKCCKAILDMLERIAWNILHFMIALRTNPGSRWTQKAPGRIVLRK